MNSFNVFLLLLLLPSLLILVGVLLFAIAWLIRGRNRAI